MDLTSTFFSFYFLLGLGAVVVLFLTVAMIGFALFSENIETRARLIKVQTVFFVLTLTLLVFVSRDLSIALSELVDNSDGISPTEIGGIIRELASLLLLGISAVFSGLLTAFAWIKLGRANPAFNILVSTIFSLKVALSAQQTIVFIGTLASSSAEDFRTEFYELFAEIGSSFGLWLPIMASLLAVSTYFQIRRRAKNRASLMTEV
ncbi:MAG: hypothetical protein ACI84O_000391 [Myxococcota bacterium]|jgi:hypothetical protein